MRIRIENFRLGFATNSSSSHSVVLLPPGASAVALRSVEPQDDNSYGWDQFRLTTPETKIRYLAAQLFCANWEDSGVREALARRFAPLVPDLEDILASSTGPEYPPISVDHQSRLALPVPTAETVIDQLIRFFASDRVVILGGNDNGGEMEPPDGAVEVEAMSVLRRTWESNRIRVRTDGDFLTFFDGSRGTKIRLSVDPDKGDDLPARYTKAAQPELVDLKITNYCDALERRLPCAPFCYQASTTKGRHAPLAAVHHALDLMQAAEVFEVAIGGGEPTLHPDFATILALAARRNIVPNFTTADTAWLDNPSIVEAVARRVGGIGVSVHSAADMTKAEAVCRVVYGHAEARTGCAHVMAQHVVGAVPLDQTAEVVRRCHERRLPLLLLGYKETGFGARAERYDGPNSDLYLMLGLSELDLQEMSLSVDTALAEQHPRLLKSLRVPDALVSAREGAFSCYVDATTGRMGPSSYAPASQMAPLPQDASGFLAVFSAY